MKSNFSHIGLARLCGWFGITRQAYYQNSWRAMDVGLEHQLILQQIMLIRQDHPRIGTRKLQEMTQPFLLDHQIKMGRDALFNLLSINNLLVRKRKRTVRTTYSNHWLRKYPNLIRELVPAGPNQLWVSDITYWKVNEKHLYISLITDAYSHKIVGYHLAETLEAVESVKALKMALKSIDKAKLKHELIHHSDRGV
jgi:putative transposase